MTQAASCSIQFDRNRETCGNTGSQAKKETEAKAVADSKDDVIGHRSGQQPQWTVLPAQQIVSEVEAAQHVEAGPSNADGGDCGVVHAAIVTLQRLVTGSHSAYGRASSWAIPASQLQGHGHARVAEFIGKSGVCQRSSGNHPADAQSSDGPRFGATRRILFCHAALQYADHSFEHGLVGAFDVLATARHV